MEKEKLEELVNLRFTAKQIALELNTSKTNVRYWLKKHGLTLLRGRRGKLPKDFELPRSCKCGETDPKKFYGNKRFVCGVCHNRDVYTRGKHKRLILLAKFGSKCCICGYDKFSCSLQFHHLDPNEKDPAFRSARSWTMDRWEQELKKCVLLCANCHAAVHAGFLENPTKI